jgi:S-formylglutathione hydrolase FrmB
VSLAPALADTALYVWAGDGTEEEGGDVVDGFESRLLEHHEVFTERLAELGIEAAVEAGSGIHDWVTWDPAFERALPLLLAAIEG